MPEEVYLFMKSLQYLTCSIHEVIEIFSKASGATINTDKSQAYLFNMLVITQKNIFRIVGFTISTLPSKHIGAPLISYVLL